MLHILLLLLKIIGFLLLAVVILLLIGVLTVLLVPVRYRGDGVMEGSTQARITVTWLFHALKAELCFDKDLRVKVRALWFVIMDEILWPDTEPEEEPLKEEYEPEPLPAREKQEPEPVPEREEQEPEPFPAGEEPEPEPEPVVLHGMDLSGEEPKKGILEKITSWIRKLFWSLKSFFLNIEENLDSAGKKYRKFERILSDEKNQKTFRLVMKQIKVLIRHILPVRLDGWVRFGFDDPYHTGQVLTLISPFYAIYGNHIKIEPVFDEKTIAGELHLKGRIRAGRVLWCGARVLMDKNFRKLLRKLRR